jgi:hypothetical protein
MIHYRLPRDSLASENTPAATGGGSANMTLD